MRIPVGEQARLAQKDQTKHDPLELGEAFCKDVMENVWLCIDAHKEKIDEPVFCVVLLICTDSLIYGLKRRKYYAWPFLPNPRPNQVVFYYEKSKDSVIRLWSMPNPAVMATISEMSYVAPQWQQTKFWCDRFFFDMMHSQKTFHQSIREMHGISLECETEMLTAKAEELIKAGANEPDANFSDPFDFSKIMAPKIIDPQDIGADEKSFNRTRQA